jgi:hypothetical protein
MDTLFKASATFASLSLKDLIEARDLFHYHLINKKNVVATALGLYRIRKTDPWPSKEHPRAASKPRDRHSEPRTLFNSEVRPYSWPCVYAFVSAWEYEETLAGNDPADVVPKTLYLPDGRAVPVCVIEARRQSWDKDLKVDPSGLTPRNLLGPGVALVNFDGQGMNRVGTAGAIVRDGERYYAMTNRHVVGAPGTPIEALQVHRRQRIGAGAELGLTRENFADVYPHFQSTGQRLLMDVGLVVVDDITQWKTEVPGIAPIGPVLDLYDNSLSLKLITMKVVGQSAISGLIRGEIHGLFYRYKAMGGSEYVSDFLIGPETYGLQAEDRKAEDSKDDGPRVALAVHHGDSGTLLFIEHRENPPSEAPGSGKGKPPVIYYPFALLWGKEEFFGAGGALQSRPYALATALSPALDRLDLDLVTDINTDQRYIWGWVGHYAIGRALPLPDDLMTSADLQAFIAKNLDLLSVSPDAALDNDPKVQTKPGGKAKFVPLADVPDNVWKSNVNFTMVDPGDGGKKRHKPGPGSRGQADNPNHFADLDLEYHGKLFLDWNNEDPDQYLNPKAWIAYFAAIKPKFDAWSDLLGDGRKGNHWGALPFRVHQLFDVMVAAVTAKDQELFLCAGGVLIHYIGDACQPLHTSYLSQGDPAKVVKRPTSPNKKLEADGVHGGYEDDMVAFGYTDKNLARTLKTRIGALGRDAKEKIRTIKSGYDASKAVIDLVVATRSDIAPRKIVKKWVSLIGQSRKDKAAAMWDAFGDDTVTCMARGTRYLAAIWQAAWDAGNGDAKIGEGRVLKPADLMKLYNNPDVAPSVALDRYPDDASTDWSKIKRPEPKP